MEYKVGDKVRRTKDSHDFKAGDVGVVTWVSDLYVDVKCPTARYHSGCWFKDMIELVERVEESEPVVSDTGHAVPPEPSKFEQIALEAARMTDLKSREYGDSTGNVGKMMAILYKEGIPVEKYDTALLLVRFLDKINRLATNVAGDAELDCWKDALGYSLIGIRQAMDRGK